MSSGSSSIVRRPLSSGSHRSSQAVELAGLIEQQIPVPFHMYGTPHSQLRIPGRFLKRGVEVMQVGQPRMIERREQVERPHRLDRVVRGEHDVPARSFR